MSKALCGRQDLIALMLNSNAKKNHGRSLEARCGGALLADLLVLQGYSACFIYTPRTTSPDLVTPTISWALLHLSLTKKNHHKLSHRLVHPNHFCSCIPCFTNNYDFGSGWYKARLLMMCVPSVLINHCTRYTMSKSKVLFQGLKSKKGIKI